MARVLIVDDEASICWALRGAVEDAGHEAVVAATAERGLELLRTAGADAVFLDLRLPDGDGFDVLDAIRRDAAPPPVIVITAHGGYEAAVRAIQSGASDYLVKPLDLAAARETLGRALAGRRPAGGADAADPAPGGLLVGRSPPMQEVYKRIGRVAASDVPVLVLGESGTGKELVARAIHAASGRRDGPFEPVDCAALPADLVEAELYGHERGAYTGADREREGRVRRAHGGTLFLDEVGELPLAAQAKLLRFLAEGEVAPIGGARRHPVDVRVVAATNRPLDRAVRDGGFREDLFYRLNVFSIELPPLRERKADIPDLVRRLIARRPGFRGTVTTEALEALARHDWPGNVRELRNAVEHAVLLAGAGGAIVPAHLPAYLAGAPALAAAGGSPGYVEAAAARLLDEALAAGVPPARHAAERLESALVAEALKRSGGGISQAARTLGLNRATVRKRAK